MDSLISDAFVLSRCRMVTKNTCHAGTADFDHIIIFIHLIFMVPTLDKNLLVTNDKKQLNFMFSSRMSDRAD